MAADDSNAPSSEFVIELRFDPSRDLVERDVEREVLQALLADPLERGAVRDQLDAIVTEEVRRTFPGASVETRISRGSILVTVLVGVGIGIGGHAAWDAIRVLTATLARRLRGWFNSQFRTGFTVKRRFYFLVPTPPPPSVAPRALLTPTTAAIAGALLAQLTLVFAVIYLLVTR